MLGTTEVGIESIGVAVGSGSVKLEALAAARNVPPSKYVDGLGTHTMSVAMPSEDTVTLAAQAATRALGNAGVDVGTVGLLAVGTETAVDHSKPVASFVQGLLGVPSRCRVFETKHACYGGTAAMLLALDWVRSGSARGKKALVVCSDIARYGIGTPGEPTQGAGAVALLISDRPSILRIDPATAGVFAKDVSDFWRPLYSKDAFVDGHYSVQCYLDALGGAYLHHRELVGANDAPARFSDRYAALAYHVPYGKMARKAHRHVRSLDGDDAGDDSFDRLVGPSLALPAAVGNVYTGSLYLALTSLLLESKVDLAGKPVGLFSYGSGSCAEFFTGTVGSEAQDRVRRLAIPELLASREDLSIAAYEDVMRARETLDESSGEGRVLHSHHPFRFTGVRDHKRVYEL